MLMETKKKKAPEEPFFLQHSVQYQILIHPF